MLSSTALGVPRFSMTSDRRSSSTRRNSLPKLARARSAETTMVSFLSVRSMGNNSSVHVLNSTVECASVKLGFADWARPRRGAVRGRIWGRVAAGAGAGGGSTNFSPASIRNGNTRMAYARAVKQFLDWWDQHRLELHEIEAVTVAAYIEQLGNQASKPTVKQHLAAIRQLFDYLTTGGILEVNPAASVRGPKYVVKRGKTPVLSAEEARKLLDSIESNTLIGPRDRAPIGTMVYSFARVGATVTMRVGDYFQHRKRLWLRLHEKGGKRHEVPCHPSLEGYLGAYIKVAGIAGDNKGRLFRSMHKGDKLMGTPMTRFDVFQMINRRADGARLALSP